MKNFIQSNRGLVGAGSVAAIAVVAFLAFGVFGIHTAFLDNEVSESGPVFASGVSAETPVGDSEDPVADSEDPVADNEDPVADSEDPVADSEDPVEDSEDPAPDGTTDGTTQTTEADTEPAIPEVRAVATGQFADSAVHSGSGDLVVLSDGLQTFLRFEDNFATDNGPDLNVYLRANDGSGDFIDLGDLKGNIGSQNYEIPVDTDLTRFAEIDIWCVRFGVSFAEARLTAT